MSPQDWIDGLMRLSHRDMGFPAVQQAAHELLEAMSKDNLIVWTPDGQALVPPMSPMGADEMMEHMLQFPAGEPGDPHEVADDTPPSLRPPKNPNLN